MRTESNRELLVFFFLSFLQLHLIRGAIQDCKCQRLKKFKFFTLAITFHSHLSLSLLFQLLSLSLSFCILRLQSNWNLKLINVTDHCWSSYQKNNLFYVLLYRHCIGLFQNKLRFFVVVNIATKNITSFLYYFCKFQIICFWRKCMLTTTHKTEKRDLKSEKSFMIKENYDQNYNMLPLVFVNFTIFETLFNAFMFLECLIKINEQTQCNQCL